MLDVSVEALPDAYVRRTIEHKSMELKRALEVGDIDVMKLCHLAKPELSLRMK